MPDKLAPEMTLPPWQFWIDTGGTFTDCVVQPPKGAARRLKVLSSGALRGEIAAIESGERVRLRGLPELPAGFLAGYRLRTAGATDAGTLVGESFPDAADVRLRLDRAAGFRPGDVVDVSAGEEAPVLAMRVATGADLRSSLPLSELRLATTRGTNALLEGAGAKVAFFVTAGFGDLLRIGDQRRPELFALCVEKPSPLHGPVVEVRERLAADGSMVYPLDRDATSAAARALRAQGVTVAAVALLHSHVNPAHERAVAEILRAEGFAHVSVSCDLAPFMRVLPRAETAVVDAVLAPVMRSYLDGVGRAVDAERFFVMTSAGGLIRRGAYRPKDSLLSGPAGGVAGAAAVARRAGIARVLTFDMGGTSTDVARWAGDFDYRFQHAVGSARVYAPALRVESVAAGGGSICRFDGQALVVGPESAGAAPGPACYGAGGPLTLTDVNLLLGRLDPARFAVPLAVEHAERRLEELIATMQAQLGSAPERDEVLRGFLAIANERMAEAIRRISVRQGYDPAEHALVAFGGAGGLHACAVAELLDVREILVPANAGLLSAAGLRDAVQERFAQRQLLELWPEILPRLDETLGELEREARASLGADGMGAGDLQVRRVELELRFAGQESTLTIVAQPLERALERFHGAHRARYGYIPPDRAVEVVTARVVVSEIRAETGTEEFEPQRAIGAGADAVQRLARAGLRSGDVITGPALVTDAFSTLFLAPKWRGVVGSAGSIRLETQDTAPGGPRQQRPEAIELELFTCRFTALVEAMGGLLQRTALSVNVKERLDFSCALLDARGWLVANAPHIPVHLGALGLCVRELMGRVAMEPGDVVVTNHPGYGGSHLPDITLVAPVHADDGSLLGFVANRAHHAEIGGVRPGSMSPAARTLEEEGVVLAPLHLVRGGVANWEMLRTRLQSASHPTRAIEENLADLHAQLASIRQGGQALISLARLHGAERMRYYMDALQARAADAMAAGLLRFSRSDWAAADVLDDGTAIRVRCTRDASSRRLRIDFTGTGPVHAGNLNATPAIVRSATLYVLRLLAGCELPLNEGLMRDVELIVPSGCVLAPEFFEDPARCPAVAGGNVETSQRVVDVLLTAFDVVACSQGTMNNLIIGGDGFSYYETVGGGTGAGPGFRGCDAVHSHMTNTAITDPEVLEWRLPVRLERFAIRRGSGGAGDFAGGDGLEREFRFLREAELSLVTQRRTYAPRGRLNGAEGARGAQWIERCDGTRERLDGVVQRKMAPGDRLILHTPGGGGWRKVR